jgi:hypothetical protein
MYEGVQMERQRAGAEMGDGRGCLEAMGFQASQRWVRD